MGLSLVGLSHKTAPLDVRERLHVGEGDLASALAELKAVPGVREGFILSTCNRVEVLGNIEGSDGVGRLASFLHEMHGQVAADLGGYLYEYEDERAVAHVFRVAASLDSMVIGEPQIVAQVKEALAAGREAGMIGPMLGPVLERALAVAKRVRNETGIARNAVSISFAAVELARKIFDGLEGRRALLLGAGEMSELAAQHLVKHGVDTVLVANRSAERASAVAAAFSGQVVDWRVSLQRLADVDIVLTSTAAPEVLVRVEDVRRILPARRYRPLFIIDIAVPRDVDPAVNALDNVYLYDVDDLQGVVDDNLAARQREAAAAEDIIRVEARRFAAELRSRDVAPTIVELRRRAEELRRDELERARQRLVALTPEQEAAVEQLTRGIIARMLHGPFTDLKRAARSGEAASVVQQLRRMYGLDA